MSGDVWVVESHGIRSRCTSLPKWTVTEGGANWWPSQHCPLSSFPRCCPLSRPLYKRWLIPEQTHRMSSEVRGGRLGNPDLSLSGRSRLLCPYLCRAPMWFIIQVLVGWNPGDDISLNVHWCKRSCRHVQKWSGSTSSLSPLVVIWRWFCWHQSQRQSPMSVVSVVLIVSNVSKLYLPQAGWVPLSDFPQLWVMGFTF